mgnify:CR=1 FL=1
MNPPGVLSGIAFALIASLAAALLGIALPLFFAASTSLALTLAVLTLAYLIYLLKRSQESGGRLVVIAGWFVLSVGLWMAKLPLSYFVLAQAGTIWFIRSLYYARSIFASLMDLALVTIGLAAGGWAITQTGSVTGALWSFFFTQSLFSLIPGFFRNPKSKHKDAGDFDRFRAAHRVAQDALRKLSTHPQ